MGNNKNLKVFLCYKRQTSWELARLLYISLKEAGFNPFLDIEKLPLVNFEKQLFKSIEQTDVFLLILTRDTLNTCSTKGDWLIQEWLYAIKQNKPILIIKDSTFKIPTKLDKKIVDYLNNYRNEMLFFDAYSVDAQIKKLIKILRDIK